MCIQPDSGDDSDDEDSSSNNEEDTPVKKPNGSKVNRSPNKEISEHTKTTEQTEKSEQTEQTGKTEKTKKIRNIEKNEQTGQTVKTVNNIKSIRNIQSVKKPKTQSNGELPRPLPSHHPLPSHFQSAIGIANQEAYYEPNPVDPVVGHYYDYEYDGSAIGPSQPVVSLRGKAFDVPREYYSDVPKEPYKVTLENYAKQQYYNQTVDPLYVEPGYYYYDYVPVAEKGSDFETLAYQNSSYQQQQPEQYYFYGEGGANDNNNNNNYYRRTNPTIPVYDYGTDNQASKNYGQSTKGPKQEQAMYYNFDSSNNYSNCFNHYYKPG